jgi:hypothetical protein
MNLFKSLFSISCLLPLILCLTGCAEVVGIVAGGIHSGLTGAPIEESLDVADKVTRDIKEKEAQQAEAEAQKRQEAALLAKLPVEWKHDGSDLFRDDNGNWNYVHPDQQTWYKYVGNVWVDPNANTVTSAVPIAPVAAPAPTRKFAASEETIDDARKAKRAQGLQGWMFQHSTTKVWFLENGQGANKKMYKLDRGTFVKLTP